MVGSGDAKYIFWRRLGGYNQKNNPSSMVSEKIVSI